MSIDYPYLQSNRSEIVKFLPDSTQRLRVLEIGCSSGEFRKFFPSDCEYWGVEPIQEIAEIARISLDHVLVGTYDEIQGSLPDHFFDWLVNDLGPLTLKIVRYTSLALAAISAIAVLIGLFRGRGSPT